MYHILISLFKVIFYCTTCVKPISFSSFGDIIKGQLEHFEEVDDQRADSETGMQLTYLIDDYNKIEERIKLNKELLICLFIETFLSHNGCIHNSSINTI